MPSVGPPWCPPLPSAERYPGNKLQFRQGLHGVEPMILQKREGVLFKQELEGQQDPRTEKPMDKAPRGLVWGILRRGQQRA